MKKSIKSIVLKILKITGITIAVLLLLLFLLPTLFPETITNKVKSFANEKLNGELSFKETNLSFFTHFPSLTLSLDEFLLKGSAPFEKDTLISAKEIAFGINVKSIFFDEKIKIDKIFVSDGFINVKVNKKGQPNYNVYVSESKEESTDSTSASIKLERIDIKKIRLVYEDQSAKMLIKAKEFNYLGKGDLHESIFDLKTKAQIEGFDFSFDNEEYLKNKKVNAELITKINTNSLALIFEENNLMINKLPVEFKGKFNFLKNGYDLDFNVKSVNSKLNDFFTALPPQFITWLSKTNIKGKTDLLFSLRGKYIAEENKKPDIHFNMKIRDGFISYNNTPLPAENIFLNFDTKLPSLDIEKLILKIDSVYFDVGKDFFNGNVKVNGLSSPTIDARIRSKLDLAKLDQAFGLENMDLKGSFSADIVSKGKYNKEQKKFPVTRGNLELKNGFVKTIYYPNPIKNINFKAVASDASGEFKDLNVLISPATLEFEGKPFDLYAKLQNFDDIDYDIKAKGELNIEKIYKVFSQKGLGVTGFAKMDVAFQGKQSDATSGKYANLNNKGTLELKEIKINSEFLPKPFIINEGLFLFNQDKMNFNNFIASYGQSDFKMNGFMENVINFTLSDSEILKGSFSVDSDFIQINEFMAFANETQEEKDKTVQNGVVVIPSKFDFNLKANVKKINFDDLNIENLIGKVNVNQGKLMLQNTSFSIIGTKVTMNAIYFHETPTRADFDYKIKALDFDIKRAYNEIALFREMASAAEYAEGTVSLDYKIAGKLDGNMTPVFPSLIGGGTLSVKNVKMKGFKLFNIVSQKTETDALKDPDISKIDIKTTVKNNLIKIERFKFKSAGFRPRIEGETSFDGKINLKMRIGLPPLGIIGIPIKVTGTQENLEIGVGKKTEDLEETEYVEGMEEAKPEIKTTTTPSVSDELKPQTVIDSIKTD
ncbi:AsmA-like C-terminal region-containing protein [Flavobacterium azooxidireducens]|uniref:AsmA-like C-terminal region-containing protein n=1 Tax=Flavobacterium azooxidireducens TaxID=1871076 RepID=A0ABY4KEG8_9FLAO|nr:AsmA family protein [Flavobacterium azooxidireducens]UPQ77785.1 AsmA-like C-terminal region-containing protein [Flavobacterium azooxidireducens]